VQSWVSLSGTHSVPTLVDIWKDADVVACRKLRAAETWPCGAKSEDYIDRFESFEVDKSRLQTLLDRDRIISPWDTTWYAFVQDYTKSHLTKMSDRLIALQGLASQIASVTDDAAPVYGLTEPCLYHYCGARHLQKPKGQRSIGRRHGLGLQ
jgi:hypothetical protein